MDEVKVQRVPFEDIDGAAWDKVGGPTLTPMQSHLWARAYAETLADGPLEILVCGDPKAPDGLLPLAKSRLSPRRLALLGSEDLWESVEVSARTERASRMLARAVAMSSRPIGFGHYRTGTPFTDELLQSARGRCLVLRRPVEAGASPRIQLDASWTSPETKISSRRRSDLRRMSRLASEMGDVTFDILSPRPSEVESCISEASDVEANGWKGRSGTAVGQNAALAAFFETYAKLASESGILRACFMRIDNKPAAAQIAVELNRSFWLLKVGFDETFKRCSPGNLLLRETIAFAARCGLDHYEFLGKEALWTTLWASGAHRVETLRIYPISAFGAGALASDLIEATVRRVRGRIEGKQDESVADRSNS